MARKAYEAGAKNVHVEWSDEELTKTKFELAPDEAFHEFPEWIAKGYEEMAENGAAFLSITGSNPDLLKDADPEQVSNANKASGKAMEGFRSYIIQIKLVGRLLLFLLSAGQRKSFLMYLKKSC